MSKTDSTNGGTLARGTCGRGSGVPAFRAAMLTLTALAMFTACASAIDLPAGYLPESESQPMLDKTLVIRLEPDLSHLESNEQEAVTLLLEVGETMHDLFELSRHHQALTARAQLASLHERLGDPTATQNLVDLYRIYKGPIGRNLAGKIAPIVPVDERVPGRNVYAWGVTKDELNAYMEAHPDSRSSILGLRTVVRRSSRENIDKDLAVLRGNPVINILHPGLAERLEQLQDGDGFYAVPYSVAYAQDLLLVYEKLNRAADLMAEVDPPFSRYLRHRSVDLLRDDYEAGDAAWVTSRFGNINAQIGAYETYSDQLYGVKSFFGASVLVKDREMTSSLTTVGKWLQDFEDLLPYESDKQVRSDIPIGVYEIVADYGQARGTNTASILPNESYITSRYGRTILIRRNILENPDLFQIRKDAYDAAVADEFHDYYRLDGDLFRTLFHEIGHYLGPDFDKNGRTLDIALEEDASILEELKADLISLFLVKRLQKMKYYPLPRVQAVEAAGIRRVLRKSQPAKSQVYATMQLMQMNYYLEKGLLTFDPDTEKLHIDTGAYHAAVRAMLEEVLALQYDGDKAAADAFVDKYATWDDALHGVIAGNMKATERYRYVLVRYAALGE